MKKPDGSISDGQDSYRRKVAIIGSGLAGLHSAYLLRETRELRKQFDVHIFEANDKLGLDGSSITVDDVRIDVPLRSFNAGYYPNLMKLYRKLGVSIRKANFTFSFAAHSSSNSPFFLYNGHSGLRGISLPSQLNSNASFASLASQLQLLIVFIASYFSLLILASYHSVFGHLQDPSHRLSSESLSSWLSRHSTMIKPIFVESLLIPLFSAMATSTTGQVYTLPTAEVLLYISSTFLRSHYTVTHGVGEAQDRLIENIPRQNIHLATPIHRVVANPSKSGNFQKKAPMMTSRLMSVDVKTQVTTSYDGFHHIIFATPANFAATLLQSYGESLLSSHNTDDGKAIIGEQYRVQELQDQLRKVQYATSTVFNHTDVSLLPRNQKDWRDLNLMSPLNGPSPPLQPASERGAKTKPAADYTMATHLCHFCKSSPKKEGPDLDGDKFIFQTTNPLIYPSPDTILSSSTFSRALTLSKSQLQGLYVWKKRRGGIFSSIWEMQLGHLHHQENKDYFSSLWFCGSYSQGIPLLEGCITSSTLVVAAIIDQEARRKEQIDEL